jgi:hypothetical protein
LRWQLERNPLKSLKKGQCSALTVTSNRHIANSREDGFTWLGHATFLFTLGGRHFITDPVLYDVSVVKRQTVLPCSV